MTDARHADDWRSADHAAVHGFVVVSDTCPLVTVIQGVSVPAKSNSVPVLLGTARMLA